MEESIVQMYDLKDKVAIVTGASQGLGVSFARGLTKASANVVLTARNFNKLQKVTEDLSQYSHQIIPIRADITKPKDVENLIKETVANFGKIDILVNNAGIATVEKAEDMSLREWQQVIDTNITGIFLCAQVAGCQMLRQGYGKIINIASQYGFVGASYVPQVSYVASKSAVLGLTRELAVEWAPRGLHVVALAPGFFRSTQTIWAFEEDKKLGKKLLARIPMGRMGKLEELEATIVFLASAASGYMNGQALILDGGFLSW
mgnify:CR=1 FL=1